MPNTDKIIFLPQLQRYDQKIKGWADSKFLTKADIPSLPKATATTLGGVKVGNGLSVTDDGVLSAEDDIVFTWDFDTSAFSCNKTFAEVKKIITTGVRRTATANGLPENFSITLLVGAANDNGVMFFGTAPTDTFGSGMLGSKTYGTTTYLFQTGLVITYTPDGHIQMNEDLSDLNTNMSFDFKNTTFQYDQYNSFDLKNGGITSAKLADGAVTAAKIEDGTITANKIADGVIDAATDVRVNGESITTDGVADILAAVGNEDDSSKNSYGVIKSRGLSFGILFHKDGICLAAADENEINSRKNHFKPIPPALLDYAVKAAMCDGKGAAWTDAEKLAARKRIGLGGDFELIEEITLAEDAVIVRTATPSGKQYAFSKILVDFIVPSQENKKTYYVKFDNTDTQPNVLTAGATGIESHFSQWAYCESGKMFQFAHGTATQNGRDSVNVLSSTRIPEVGKIEYLRIWAYETNNSLLPAGTNIKIYGAWA